MHRALVILLSGVLILSSSKNGENPIDSSPLTPSMIVGSNELDFSMIRDWFDGKRIVALGESSHGIGDFYQFKSELVKYLHKELDYEVLAMESSYGDANAVWLDIDLLSAGDIMSKSVPGNFRCEEILDLFEYIKTTKDTDLPLILYGYDPQISSEYLMDQIKDILLDIDPILKDSLLSGINSYYSFFPTVYGNDSVAYTYHTEKIRTTAIEVVSALKDNKDHLLKTKKVSQEKLGLMIESLNQIRQFTSVSYANRFNEEYIYNGIVLRDKMMADNISSYSRSSR